MRVRRIDETGVRRLESREIEGRPGVGNWVAGMD